MFDSSKQIADSRQTLFTLINRTLEIVFDWVAYVKSQAKKD